MHFLLTNDDGIDAHGIAALVRAVRGFGKVTVVAPSQGYSGCGHQVTAYQPISVRDCGGNRFAVDGTPADCVRIGLKCIAPDVDWVLSGVNDGGNLGVDLLMSGTAAAAREANWLGKPSIALSQYQNRDRKRDWDRTALVTARILANLLERKRDPHQFWNINLPDVDTPPDQVPLVETHPESKHMLVDFRVDPPNTPETDVTKYSYVGDYRARPRTTGSDVDVCFGGSVSVGLIDARSMR